MDHRPRHPQACGFSKIGRLVGLITVPIPLLLNATWFYQMLKGAAKALRGGDRRRRA